MAVLALAACDSQPKTEGYYDVAPDDAYGRIIRADITGFRNARQCGMLIHFLTDPRPRSSITWTVTSGSVTVAKFTVRITPHETGSVISIEVPKAPKGGESYDGTQTYTHPGIMQPLRPAVRELIDAAIEGRPYDWHRIPDPLNTDGLCGSMRSNFEASGQPYRIDDPSGMTHAMAEHAREQGAFLRVETDQYFVGR